MFGNKKSFNEGMKSGIRLSEEIVKRNTEAIDKIRKTNENQTGDIKELMESVEELIKNFEIEKLFGIEDKPSPDDLEKEEKIILFEILGEISERYNSNNNQKKFLRNLKLYFEINFEYLLKENNLKNAINNIDSKEAEKIMYKIIKEYLYLENNTSNYGNKYDEYLSLFVYGIVYNKNIENEIECKVKRFGEEILYQQFSKYSYDFENKKNNSVEEKINIKDYYIETEEKEKKEITKEIFELYLKDYNDNTAKNKYYEVISYDIYVETTNFIVYPKNDKLISLNKETKEKTDIVLNFEISKQYMTNELFRNKKITSYNDILYIIAENNEVHFHNIVKNKTGKIELPKSKYKKFNIKVDKNILCYLNNCSNIFLMDTGKHYKHFSITEKTNSLPFFVGCARIEKFDILSSYPNNIVSGISSLKEYYVKYYKENYICKSIEKNHFFIIKNKDIYFLSADDKTWKLKRFNIETEFMEDYSLEFEKKDWLNNKYKILKIGEYLNIIYLIFYINKRIDIVSINLNNKKIKNSFLGIKQSIFWNKTQIEECNNFLVMRDIKNNKIYMYDFDMTKDKLIISRNQGNYIKLGKFLTTQNKDKIYELK